MHQHAYMRASIRPCLGHGIDIQTKASVRHVRDMHQPYYDIQCNIMSGTWHRHRDECQCKTCLGHASALTEIASHAYMRASVRPCLGHGISNISHVEGTYMVRTSNEPNLENVTRIDDNDVFKLA
ncbi:CTP synthase [Gossypium arboreum]|uniref:CTP synthase n=1 Tax=Gossypium arboreum TaxID=29729 RepID=A0A0B0N3T0_GOSAR|nr:CTP synthase [Gossypium arboreum]